MLASPDYLLHVIDELIDGQVRAVNFDGIVRGYSWASQPLVPSCPIEEESMMSTNECRPRHVLICGD